MKHNKEIKTRVPEYERETANLGKNGFRQMSKWRYRNLIRKLLESQDERVTAQIEQVKEQVAEEQLKKSESEETKEVV